MKKTGLLSGALFLGAMICASVPAVQQAHAEEGATATVIAKPVRDWQEPPIQDLTGQGGKVVRKVCAIESRFDNEVLMAVLRNKSDEYALRMFFPTMMFAPGTTYPITISSGDFSNSFTAVPVYPGTVLVEIGKDETLLTSYANTGSLKIKFSQSSFDFQSGDFSEGIDILTACADTLGSAVSSAGVAGPLPTAPVATGTPGMAMPPSVAQITVADLGEDTDTSAATQGHIQEQMVLKPLKGDTATEETLPQLADTAKAESAADQKKESHGFSMFSIFGDVDETELDSGDAITAEKHFDPNAQKSEVKPVLALKEDAPAEVKPDEPAENVVAAEEEQPAQPEPAMETATETATAEPEVEPEPELEAQAEVKTEPAAAPAPKAKPAEVTHVTAQDIEPVPQPKTKPDEGRMIVFADDDDEPVADIVYTQPEEVRSAPGAQKEIKDVLAAAQGMDMGTKAEPVSKTVATAAAPVASSANGDIEGRLEDLEKRLAAEVERNRQLEMQMRDMSSKPVSGTASIDLENPDKPAVVPQQTTTEDRVEAARQEREQIKNDKLNQRMETLATLLQQAGVSTVASPAPEGDLDADNNAFSWHTGQFYGGAEFGTKPRDVEFSNLVSAYLDATGQRCQGDFASHLDRIEMLGNGSIATAEVVCVGQEADTAAAVVLYEDSQTFGVITHEGSSDELGLAISIRDSIAGAIATKM